MDECKPLVGGATMRRFRAEWDHDAFAADFLSKGTARQMSCATS